MKDIIEKVSLSELVDLSIGSPEKGAVNFNLLKCILKVLIRGLLAEDDTLHVAFRGASAEVVRILRESLPVPCQSLDMEVLTSRRLETPDESRQTRMELDDVKLDMTRLQDSMNNIRDQVNELVRCLPNSFQVSPVLLDDEFNLLWKRNESGYKTEPSRSEPLDSSQSIDMVTQKSELLPQPGENSTVSPKQYNETLFRYVDDKTERSSLIKSSQGERYLQPLGKIPFESTGKGDLEILYERNRDNLPDTSESSCPRQNAEFHIPDMLSSSHQDFKIGNAPEKKSNASPTKVAKIKIVDLSKEGTPIQTGENLMKSVSKKYDLKKTTHEEAILSATDTCDKNNLGEHSKILDPNQILDKQLMQDIPVKIDTSRNVDVAQKGHDKSDPGPKRAIKKESTEYDSTSDPNKVARMLDIIHGVLVDLSLGRRSSVKLRTLPSKFKMDKKEKLELARKIKSINLSSLYGMNRHCNTDDPAYLNSDMFDDKGLLKPMYDTGCFQSAYAEALRKYSSSTANTSVSTLVELCDLIEETFEQENVLRKRPAIVSTEELLQKRRDTDIDTVSQENIIQQIAVYSTEKLPHTDKNESNAFKRIPTDIQKYLYGSTSLINTQDKRMTFKAQNNSLRILKTETTDSSSTTPTEMCQRNTNNTFELDQYSQDHKYDPKESKDSIRDDFQTCRTKSVRFAIDNEDQFQKHLQNVTCSKSILKQPSKIINAHVKISEENNFGDTGERAAHKQVNNRIINTQANTQSQMEAKSSIPKQDPLSEDILDKEETAGMQREFSKTGALNGPAAIGKSNEMFTTVATHVSNKDDFVNNEEVMEKEPKRSGFIEPSNTETFSTSYVTTDSPHESMTIQETTRVIDSDTIKSLEDLVTEIVRTELSERGLMSQSIETDLSKVQQKVQWGKTNNQVVNCSLVTSYNPKFLQRPPRGHGARPQRETSAENIATERANVPKMQRPPGRHGARPQRETSEGNIAIERDNIPKMQRPPGRHGARPQRGSPHEKESPKANLYNGYGFESPSSRPANRFREQRNQPNGVRYDTTYNFNSVSSDFKEKAGEIRRTPFGRPITAQDKTDVRRPPGRHGARPEREDTSKNDGNREIGGPKSHLSREQHSAFTMGGRNLSINVLHVNRNYLDVSSSILQPDLMENFRNNSDSMDDLSTLFPKWTKCHDLDSVVSELLAYVTQSPNDPFRRSAADAFNIILHILEDLLNTKSQAENTNVADNARVATLQTRIDSLESEMIKISSLIREAKLGEKKESIPALTKEALHSIKQLQNQMEEVHRKLDVNSDMMDENKMCLESLYDVVKDMDRKKMERKQLDMVTKDIIERSRMDEKVDVGEFRSEVRRLGDAIAEANVKQDMHRKFQMLQCDVTNKIFELLPTKLEKKEYEDLSDEKLSVAMSKLEAKLKKFVQDKRPNASGSKKPIVLRDLLCISCNNEVEMQGDSIPFYKCQHKTLRLDKKSSSPSQNRYCPGGIAMTHTQKLALAKRYPWGDFGDVIPPHISVIARKYLNIEKCINQEGLLMFPHLFGRSLSK